jgi:hypothetical protein
VNGEIMVNTERQLMRNAEDSIHRIFDELSGGSIEIQRNAQVASIPCDVLLQVTSKEAKFKLAAQIKARITPQTAMSVCEKLAKTPKNVIPLVFAPAISPRVAEILGQHGIGYVDEAGNCRINSVYHRLLIDRHGYKSPTRPPKKIVDLFSPKSSRIVRAMLAQPAKGWQVRELATHPDIEVSVGLAAKVKQTLVEESYAIEHERLLYLRDPVGLLENWAKSYSGPAEQMPMFFRGNTEEAEKAVAQWSQDNDIAFALGGLSAAWRLAPEVRYNVAAVYVESRGFDREILRKLESYQGGKPVETGANLLLCCPYDRSVFVGSHRESKNSLPVTSAIQAYLDLKRLGGRGEEAAAAVYERLIAQPLKEAAQQIEEMRHAGL